MIHRLFLAWAHRESQQHIAVWRNVDRRLVVEWCNWTVHVDSPHEARLAIEMCIAECRARQPKVEVLR